MKKTTWKKKKVQKRRSYSVLEIKVKFPSVPYQSRANPKDITGSLSLEGSDISQRLESKSRLIKQQIIAQSLGVIFNEGQRY